MSEPKSTQKNRKPRNNCPISLHSRGVWYKKIHGKFHYFTKDKEQSLQQYYELMAILGGSQVVPSCTDEATDGGNPMTIRTLCNLYLDHQKTRLVSREIQPAHWHDQQDRLTAFAKHIGPDRRVVEVKTIEIQQYRTKLILAGRKRNTVNNHLGAIKAMYHWAEDNDVGGGTIRWPNLRAVKKVPPPVCPERDDTKDDQPGNGEEMYLFSTEEIKILLEHANDKLTAMIWLGLNCAFGCTDISDLRWSHLDLEAGTVCLPRGKTGVKRCHRLFPKTIAALKKLPRAAGPRVFYTKRGNPYVRTDPVTFKTKNTIAKVFGELIHKAGLKVPPGTNFYALRRRVATETAKSGNPYAVQGVMGHKNTRMADRYIQEVKVQTQQAVHDMEKWVQPLIETQPEPPAAQP